MVLVRLLWLAVMLILTLTSCVNETGDHNKKSNVLDPMDAVITAPSSHEILLENDKVRVLKVTIPPGEKEPMHNHNWESVMYVDHPAMIRYYDDKGTLIFESKKENFSYEVRDPSWMKAEGVHAVENIDTVEYSAIRVELKN